MPLSTSKNQADELGDDITTSTTIKIWGSRGSIPRSESTMTKYGGSTSCVEYISGKGTRIVLDMGSGSYGLGQHIVGGFFGAKADDDDDGGGEEKDEEDEEEEDEEEEGQGSKKAKANKKEGKNLQKSSQKKSSQKQKSKSFYSTGSILLTHTHWDHIQGFPFFVPLFIPSMTWDVYGPRGSAGSIRDSLAGQMQYDYFPVNLGYLGAQVRYHDLGEGVLYLPHRRGGGGERDWSPPPLPLTLSKDGDRDDKEDEHENGDGRGDAKAKDANGDDVKNPSSRTDDEQHNNNNTNDNNNNLCHEIGGKSGSGSSSASDVVVTTRYLHHPCLTLGYRLYDTTTQSTVCYITDHEPYDMRMGTEGYNNPNPIGNASGGTNTAGGRGGGTNTTTSGNPATNARERRTADDRHVQFISGCDLLLHDSQYAASEYPQKVTWGHSTVEYVVDVALAAGVKQLGLYHHDPMRTDEEVDELVKLARERAKRRWNYFGRGREDMEIFAAYDKQVIVLEGGNDDDNADDDANEAIDASTTVQKNGNGGGDGDLTVEEEVGANDSRSSKEARPLADAIVGQSLPAGGPSAPPASSSSGNEFCGQVTLIFGDDADSKPIASLLEVGCVVRTYTDAEAALEVAERDLCSLYIVQQDNGGGGMTGVDFCRQVRTMGDWGEQVPILVETPDQDTLESIRAEGDEAGVTDFVSKPYSPEYVRTKAHIAMSRSPCRWRKADLPKDEELRLETLRATGLLDTEPEDRFDRLTRIAARAFDVPTVLISLVDRDRQWFKSCEGLCATQTPRDQAFCAHAILQDNVFLIQDATKDDRFADNPLVTGGVVRFYAGIPLSLVGKNGLKHRIGTLCLIDTTPRDLDADSIRLLEDLGHLVEAEIEQSLAAEKAKSKSAHSLRTDKTTETTVIDGEGRHVTTASCCATM